MSTHYNPLNMLYIPEEHRTQEMYNMYYNIQKHQFYKIPDMYKTEQLCQSACKDNIKNILNIPKKLHNKKFVLSLENHQDAVLEFIKHIIPIDEEIIFHFAKQNGGCLKYVDQESITEKIANIAFLNDKTSMFYFPDYLKNEKTLLDIIKLNLKTNPSYFLQLPKKYQTKEMFNNIEKGWREYEIFKDSDFCNWLDADLFEKYSEHEEVYQEIQDYINDEKCILKYD